MLVTFEGIDFCGKSVQLELLAKKIVNLHKSVIIIREPGGTVISEKIRDILLRKEHERMNPISEMLLYSAARAQLVQEKIVPNITTGCIILCDRYFDSTTAYQGYGREIDLDVVRQINSMVTQHITPDITYLLDIDVGEMERRKKRMNESLDRMEEESKFFFNKVRQGYLKIAAEYPQRFKVLNGMKSIPGIENEIWNHFTSNLQGGDNVRN